MKKILAIAAIISAISLGCGADLFGESVWVTIDNESGDDARVTGKDGGDISVDDTKSERCAFKLKQNGSEFKTTLTVRPVNDTMSRGTSVEITGKSQRTLTLKPGSECELDGKIVSTSKKRGRGKGQDKDRSHKNKKRKTTQAEDQD